MTSEQRAFTQATPSANSLHLVTARKLQSKEFPPIKWIVNDILPEGLTLFCGKPKIGKSWFALDLAFAVSDGSQFMGNLCDDGDVLYLALEDNERRLQERLRKIRPDGQWPSSLSLTTQSPRLNAGGIEALKHWIATTSTPRLIIIDTLAVVKPIYQSNGNDYQADYRALHGLQELAAEHRVAIVVVHHVRKADADDPFDTVSGSTGLTGAADTTIILTRRPENGGVVLYGRGRDLPEFEHAVEFISARCRWKILGDPDAVFLSDTRKQISKVMGAGAKTITEIAGQSGLPNTNVRQTLRRMVLKGQAKKLERGCYTLEPLINPTPVTTVTLSQSQP